MTLTELRNISEVSSIRVVKHGQTSSTKIRCILLVVQWNFGQNILTVTDFTRLAQSNAIHMKVNDRARGQIRELEERYRSVRRREQSLMFLDNDHLIFVSCIANVTLDGGRKYQFTLEELKLLNKDPMSILSMGEKLRLKVKDLANQLQKKRLIETVKNEDIHGILGILSRKRHQQEVKEEQDKRPKVEEELDSNVDITNPFFVFPQPGEVPSDTIKFDTQFLNTQAPDESYEISDTQVSQKETQESPSTEFETTQIQSQRYIPTVEDVSQFVQVETSASMDGSQLPMDSHRPHEDVVINSQMETDPIDVSPSFPGKRDDAPTTGYDDDPLAIARVMGSLPKVYNTLYLFSGYAVGIDPWDLKLIGKPFNQRVGIRPMRLIISNRLDISQLELNKNCIALEFDEEALMKFFELADLEGCQVGSLLEKLLEGERRHDFHILRQQKRMTGLMVDYWECADTLRGLLE